MKDNNYLYIVPTTCCGLPCLAGVTVATNVIGNELADNPDDYFGYTDIEFDILDRKGYKAKWLESKATCKDIDNIIKDIEEYIREEY